MTASIPASAIVSVNPSVLSAGGTALDLNGLFLTTNPRVPVGKVLSFPSYLTVSAFFGPSSAEAAAAAVYFLGFSNSNKKPGAILFYQYNTASVAAYLRGGYIATLTLTQLQAITGSLTVPVDGVNKTAASINLSAATSFSNAATLLSTALSALVTYDQLSGAFVVTSSTTGNTSTLGFATGTAAAALGLTAATGATLSQGAAIATQAASMNAVLAQTTDWASFTTLFEPLLADKLLFAAWTNSQNNNYTYIPWDTDVTALQGNATNCFGAVINANQYSGVAPVYQDANVAYFLMGSIASLDFTQRNGRATMAFRNQTGLPPTISDQVSFQNLIDNGYNFYGIYGTANDQFNFLYPGQVSGPFKWIDSYVNQLWMNNQFQLAFMVLLTNVLSIPYNVEGRALMQAAARDVIDQALNFGAIRAGIVLSQAQIVEVNQAAGLKIDDVLTARGWYLQILDAIPQVRAARGSPPCTFWYTDGESVQKINLASVQIQ